MKHLLLVVVITATYASTAAASDNPLVDTLADIITDERPLRTPQLDLGGGITSEGVMLDASIGYAWGTLDRGILFPGASLKRVLLGARTGFDATLVRLTAGYAMTSFGVLAADVGIEAQITGVRGMGPVVLSTTGWRGINLRYSAGLLFGEGDVRATSTVEIVFDVMDLTGKY